MDKYLKVKEKNISTFKNFVKVNDPNDFLPEPLPELTETTTIAIVVFSKQESK